jgi:glucose-6-phosphate dehydrogenase assembly protein OpcA
VRTVSTGPGLTAATFRTRVGDIKIERTDGRTATLSWPGRIDRMVALHRRDTAELLAEELRRLDPDEVYAETLSHIDTVTEEEAAAVTMDEVVDDIEDLEDLAEGE